MSATSQIILSLSPDMLSAALVRRGRILQAESLDLDASTWSEHWGDGLMRLDQPLRQLMSRFPSRARRGATLLYHSPTLTKQVYSFDIPPAAAKEAGMAKIRENIGFNDPVQATILAKPAREGQQTTALVFSEREEQLRSLYAWLNRCGVEVSEMVPISAAIMTAATEIAAKAEPNTAVFYVGSDVCVMVYADQGQLKLVRPADIGYRKLVEGYMQALHTISAKNEKSEKKDEAPKTAFSAEQVHEATDALFRHGIPMNVTEVNGVDLRTAVFPYIAPVLQRICIDIKQTLRFGLGSDDQPHNLMICGPGASIPWLNKAIAQHVDMHIKIEPGAEGYAASNAFGRGTLEWFLVESRAPLVGMLPEIAQDAMVRSKLNRGLAVGGVLAALALAGEFTVATLDQQKINAQIAAQATRMSNVNDFEQECQTASSLSMAISDVSSLVSDAVSHVPDWHHPLARLGDLTTDEIKIQELRGEYEPSGGVIEINGFAVAESDRATGAALDAFMSQLEASDGIRAVILGATSRVSIGSGQWGRQFSMKVRLDADQIPYAAFVIDADGRQGESKP